MTSRLRQCNITLMIILFILNSALVVLSVVTFFYLIQIEDENPPSLSANIIYLSSIIIKSVIGFFLVAYFGCKLIYFKMVSYTIIYYICISFLILVTLILIICKIFFEEIPSNANPDFVKFDRLRLVTVIMLAVLEIAYLLSLSMSYKYLNQMREDIETSPLNVVEQNNLSEELYHKIIRLSIDPNNTELQMDYSRISMKTMKAKSLNSKK